MIEEHLTGHEKPLSWLDVAGGLSAVFLALLLSYVTVGLFGSRK